MRDSDYQIVLRQFRDTFKILKNQMEYFGAPQLSQNKIDESVFFNSKKDECVLIVLIRHDSRMTFGSARIVQGKLQDGGVWTFGISMLFSFDRHYFSKCENNEFSSISVLARQAVLTAGNPVEEGCEIDEYFWFVEMAK